MDINRDTAIQAVRAAMERLVAKDYEALRGDVDAFADERMTSLAPVYIRAAIEDYGETLVMPPDETFDKVEFNDFDAPGPPEWWSYVDLWTLESDRSDLTLEFDIVMRSRDDGMAYDILIKELHVMWSRLRPPRANVPGRPPARRTVQALWRSDDHAASFARPGSRRPPRGRRRRRRSLPTPDVRPHDDPSHDARADAD